MDTETLLLERHEIQDRLAALRALSFSAPKPHKPWWMMLPILSLTGWALGRSRSSNGHSSSRPLLKTLLVFAAQRLMGVLIKEDPFAPFFWLKRIFGGA
jgi:hypothetical protein